MQPLKDYENVEPSNAAAKFTLDCGAYLGRITDVTDSEDLGWKNPALIFTYDVWLPNEKRWFFENAQYVYSHQFVVSLSSVSRMKQLIESCEKSSKGQFTFQNVAGWEKTLKDKNLALAITERTYYSKGHEYVQNRVVGFYSTEEYKQGVIEIPAPIDDREKTKDQSPENYKGNNQAPTQGYSAAPTQQVYAQAPNQAAPATFTDDDIPF